jgi:hypothetical protein
LPPCVCSGHSAIGGAAAKTEILILVLVLGSTAMAAGVMVGRPRAGHHIVLVAYMLGVFH